MTVRATVHIPTPMIPAHSTVLTVIAGLVAEARQRGSNDLVVIDPARAERLDPASVIAATPFRFPWGRRRRAALALDHVTGWAVGRRPAVERLYRSALRDVDVPDSPGAVVLHDASFAYVGVSPVRHTFGHVPTILHSHVALSRSLGRRELRSLVDRLDCVIAVSGFVAARLADRLGRSRDRIAVVPNGIDLDDFSPPLAMAGDRPPVVLAAGVTTPEKGFHHLDAALGLLTAASWRARIAGSGWYEPARLPSYGVGPVPPVERLGFLERRAMPDFLRSGRVFVFPSVWDEPFGIGLLEAMACGLACIASPVGGVPEVGGDAVRYVDVRDHEALAAAIDELLLDDAAATELGRRARARAMQFSVAAQYERFADVVARAVRA